MSIKKIYLGRDITQTEAYKEASKLKQRCFLKDLTDFFLCEKEKLSVAILYGLRRTGKTIAFMHTIYNISRYNSIDLEKTAYLLVDNEPWCEVDETLQYLYSKNYKNIFIDEITESEGFLDSCSILSNAYSNNGMKIAITGTDSLTLLMASWDGLLDRNFLIHSTRISFPEWSLLKNNHNIDEYMKWGGILSAIPTQGEIKYSKNPFVEKNVEGYFLSSISSNIQHALERFHDGRYTGVLANIFISGKMHKATYATFQDEVFSDFFETLSNIDALVDSGLLTGFINRIASSEGNFPEANEDLRKTWTSPDLSRTVSGLKNRHPNLLNSLKIIIEKANVDLKKMLNIVDQYNNNLLTATTQHEIMSYLEALELMSRRPVRAFLPLEPTARDLARFDEMQPKLRGERLVSQPGLRYSQTLLLKNIIEGISEFEMFSAEDKKEFMDTLFNNLKGIMLEDIILQETFEAANRAEMPNNTVYKAKFPFTKPDGEFDMVVSLPNVGNYIFEIKHSRQQDNRQFKHIIRSDYADMLIKSTGLPIIDRIVLYCGQSIDISDGYNIKYRNAGNFLHHIWNKNLPKALQEECKPLNLMETASLQKTQLSNTCSRSAPLESYDDDFSPRP